jgi:hypothetical protein
MSAYDDDDDDNDDAADSSYIRERTDTTLHANKAGLRCSALSPTA